MTYRQTDLEKTVLNPLRHTSMQFYLITGAIGVVFMWGLFHLVRQWTLGLGVTGLNRPVYWGIYLANFVFFTGLSMAGTFISAILRVTQAEWRRPITRIAEAITFFGLILGGLQIWIDMGRPERILYPMLFGRYESPFLWDFTCIGLYFLSSTLYLYVPMIPDLARMRDTMTDAAPWRQWLYRTMALGWHGGAEQHRRLEKVIGVMAILIVPIAVSVHTVVSWIFGMTMQPMWHSTLLGPYFVVGAIFSGIALLFIFMTAIRKAWKLEPWIGEKQYNYLGILLLVMTVIWAYFTLTEYLTTGYGTLTHEVHVFEAKLFGEYAPWFWTMVICNLVIPFAVLIRRKGRTPAGTVFVSVFVVIGMWIERFTIVAPSLTRPMLNGGVAAYTPTVAEWAISLGSMALFTLLFLGFFKLFPAISVWEVEEGEEIAAVQRKAEELLRHGAA